MKKLIPLLLGLVGLIAGGGVGYVLRPDAKAEHPAETPAPDGEHAERKLRVLQALSAFFDRYLGLGSDSRS